MKVYSDDINAIIKEHPSICYQCDLSRKPASDDNTKAGWVGCCKNVIQNFDIDDIGYTAELAEGWVDLKSRVKLGKGSGIITNFQLLTRSVNSCTHYKQIN